MTIEEKRMKLLSKCASQQCNDKCPIYNAKIKCGAGTSFVKKKGDAYDMPDKTIERAYGLMFGEKKLDKRGKAVPVEHACPFASGVTCGDSESKCASCGWNPKVDAKRRVRLNFLFETPAKNGLHYLHLKGKG